MQQYNDYLNPYFRNYGNLGNYGNNYQMQSQQLQQPIQTQNYTPMYYVSGIEGAKAFIVNPNNLVYLRDSENTNRVYEKQADCNGRYSIKSYDLIEVANDTKMRKNQEREIDYLTNNDFKAFLERYDNDMVNLSNKIETLLETAKTNENKSK